MLAWLGVCVAARAIEPVAVIEDAAWSPGDASREGAAEMGVLLKLAELQQTQSAVGLVGVGDRRGIFQEGTQRALEFAIRQGVPVVRLARGTSARPNRDVDTFIDGGVLSPEAAAALLADCLRRYGPLPKSKSSEPTRAELNALRRQLTLYQSAFTSRQPAMVAMR